MNTVPCLKEIELLDNIEGTSVINNASADKFLLIITPPAPLRDDIGMDSFSLKIQSIEIPNIGNTPANALPYRGKTFKTPGEGLAEFDPMPVSYIVDDDFRNYKFLYKWVNMIYDIHRGHRKIPLTSILGQITVNQLNNYKEIINQWEMKDCFPNGTGSIRYYTTASNRELIICSSAFTINDISFKDVNQYKR